jgi:hypothetical protein
MKMSRIQIDNLIAVIGVLTVIGMLFLVPKAHAEKISCGADHAMRLAGVKV